MRAWAWGLRLDQGRFAAEYFGAPAGSPTAGHLRHAAWFALTARGPADIREAADHVAAAMQLIGLDRWRRFLTPAGVALAVLDVLWPTTVADGTLTGNGMPIGGGAPSGPRVSNVVGTPAAPTLSPGVSTPAPGGVQKPQVVARPSRAGTALGPARGGGDRLHGPQVQAMARPTITPEEAEARRAIVASKGLPTDGVIPYEPPEWWTS
jgi:hypothetical protein